MVHGEIVSVGAPADLAEELSQAYLGSADHVRTASATGDTVGGS